jgi:IS30 family transposase
MTTSWQVSYVRDALRKGWAPQAIGGRLAREHPDDPSKHICAETIYAWIYATLARAKELAAYLPKGHRRRRKRPGRRVHSLQGSPGVFHWATGPKGATRALSSGTGKPTASSGFVAVPRSILQVERTTRFYVATKVEAVTSKDAVAAQKDLFSRLPAAARRSVTMDNGTEFHHHFELVDDLGMATFFADPYCAYQRGTNEHFNGILRRYLPKPTNFDDLDPAELHDIVQQINNRPLKVLDWATPAEAFHQQLQSLQATTRCTSN